MNVDVSLLPAGFHAIWTATDALIFLATKKPFQALLKGWQKVRRGRLKEKEETVEKGGELAFLCGFPSRQKESIFIWLNMLG